MRSTECSRIVHRLVPFALTLLVTLAAPHAASAQSCQWSPDLTPAETAPSTLWNGLEPTETTIPSCQTTVCASRDSSWTNSNHGYSLRNPYFVSFDIEQNTLLAATNLALQVWDLGNPGSPSRTLQRDIRQLAPVEHAQPHNYELTTDIDAPDGNSSLVAITGVKGIATLIASSAGAALYQDTDAAEGNDKVGQEVYATRIGSRDYAFSAVKGLATYSGLWVYDMTAASQLSTQPCVEMRPVTVNPQCSGVYKNRLSTEDVGHVDGAGNFVVFSAGGTVNLKGYEIWNVSNPANAFQVLSGLPNDRVDGVALWQQGAKYYLALHNRGARQGQVYDVTCIANNSCGTPTLVYAFPLVGFTSFGTIGTVTDSVSNGQTFVHFGSRLNRQNLRALQEEWLFDMSSLPQEPTTMTGGDPQNGNQGQPTLTVEGETVGYWSSYYMCKPTGTNFVESNMGKFNGNYFYRAGYSIFDVHRRRSISPLINVSGPSNGFVGEDVVFTGSALNCTPSTNGWSWNPGSGGQVISGGTTASPTLRWSTTGVKTVTASNSQCAGATQNPATITIADPAPAVGSVSRTPASAPVCTPITFTAENVTGQPTLTYSWEVLDGGSPISASACSGTPTNTDTFCWDTSSASPGTSYQGRVTVSGPGGPDATATSPTVTLTALPALPNPGFNIDNDPFTAGTVQFHSNEPGATEWRWDFDDGTILQTTDPVEGPDPVHTYTAVGTYDVTLEVRNCQNQTWVESETLEIEVLQIAPLEIITFQANCPFGQCSFVEGGTINFNVVVSGDPDFFEYDWEGTGQFELSTTVITSHSYPNAGTYSPVLRLRRGAETVSQTHSPIVVTEDDPPPPPSITVGGSGPFSLTVGQSGTYTASATNCTPESNDWIWTLSGGGTGTSNTSSITASWSSPGTKSVTARNSACGTANGSRTVSVTTGQTGGEFEADFDFSPAEPSVGQEVSFDASPSTGGPTSWSWAFGDGNTGDGEQVTHTYSQPGNYSAQLTITKTEEGCGSFGQNICTETVTKAVTVSGDGSVCVQDGKTLCLQDDRFAVTARWHNHRTGERGDANVYTPFSSDRTGMFWFFRSDNVELIVKALDGTSINGSYWFFYGGLSDVEYWITVTDTETDDSNEYHNEPGSICGFPDTGAFPVESEEETLLAGASAAQAGQWTAVPFPAGGAGIESESAAMEGTCTRTGDNLCLLDNRFSIEVDWHDQHSGNTGFGTPVVGTDRTGYFWFFDEENIELVTKMIDASDPFGYFWVLWGALSDVEYTITVTDTVTGGEPQQYHNPPGSFCGGADTTAFEAE